MGNFQFLNLLFFSKHSSGVLEKIRRFLGGNTIVV